MIAVFARSHRQAADALCGFDGDEWLYINAMCDLYPERIGGLLFLPGWSENPAYRSANLWCALQTMLSGDLLLTLDAALAAECTRRMNEPKGKSSDKGFEDIRI